jgi:predicted aspartyl protease
VSFPFDAQAGLVIVRAEALGPSGSMVLRLALDTGATSTLISVGPLAAIGYDPSLVADRVQVTTGSGVEFVPRIKVAILKALGEARSAFPVLSHTLPPSATIDGLLGLDFFRGRSLKLDFRHGRLSLE